MKKKLLCLFFVILPALLMLSLTAVAETGQFAMYVKPGKGRSTVPLLQTDGKTKTDVQLTSSDTAEVLSIRGKNARVRFLDSEYCVNCGYVRYVGKLISADPIMAATECNTAALAARVIRAWTLELTGNVRLMAPTDTLFAYIYDDCLCQMEACFTLGLDGETSEIELASLKRFISTKELSGGWKTFSLQCTQPEGQRVLLQTRFYKTGLNNEPTSLTSQCTFEKKKVLTDKDYTTGWTPAAGKEQLTVSLPANASAALLTLEWKKPPECFDVTAFDKNGNVLTEQKYATGFYQDALPLPENTAQILLRQEDSGVMLIELRVYAKGFPEEVVQQWQPVKDKVDLMVISAHQDDELLFFGGTLPYYAAGGKDIAMVYMANCGRRRYHEALNGLWTAGLRVHPIFVGYTDKLVNTLNEAWALWGQEKTVTELVGLFRKYRPEVVVTHDFNGEYGHRQHRATASAVSQAVALAADAAYAPESYERYGIWQVKKLYIHLYEENQITMTVFEEPLSDQSPVTPLDLAAAAYDKHQTQKYAFSMDKHGKTYDNRVFGLYYTSVGPDTEKNDFFENIP